MTDDSHILWTYPQYPFIIHNNIIKKLWNSFFYGFCLLIIRHSQSQLYYIRHKGTSLINYIKCEECNSVQIFDSCNQMSRWVKCDPEQYLRLQSWELSGGEYFYISTGVTWFLYNAYSWLFLVCIIHCKGHWFDVTHCNQ